MAEFVSWLPISLLVASLAGVLVFLALGGGGVLRLWALEPVGIAVPGFACLLVFTAPQMADMLAGMRHGFAGRLGELDLGVAVFLLAVLRPEPSQRYGERELRAMRRRCRAIGPMDRNAA